MPIQRSNKYKSYGRGTISITGSNTTNTATITAVNTAKTKLVFMGSGFADSANPLPARVDLTNTTTITATRDDQNGTDTTIAGYEYWEEY